MRNTANVFLTLSLTPFSPSRLRSRLLFLAAAKFLLLLPTPTTTFADSATWNLNPATGNWNHAANWKPLTIPNSPSDTATFATSNKTGVSISAGTEINGIVFNAGASAFMITASPRFRLTISGAGITNNSAMTQNFLAKGNLSGRNGIVLFSNSATAGSSTGFTTQGGAVSEGAGIIRFVDKSSAGQAMFTNVGSAVFGGHGGYIEFFDHSTAGNGIFTNNGGTADSTFGSFMGFSNNSMADDGTFTNNGGNARKAFGGLTEFFDHSSAGNSTFTVNGGVTGLARGGIVEFRNDSTAHTATLIANGGHGGTRFAGGQIWFFDDTSGGKSRVKVFGNGKLDVSGHNFPGMAIGSIEGNGNIFLGGNTLSVGSNNLSTTFYGIIQHGGEFGAGRGSSLTKVGTSSLVLHNANTYTGRTTIERGKLVVNNTTGSGTGSGPVQVNGGSLGGKGIIAGAVTVGTASGPGAILSPGYLHGASSPGALTIQSPLTFNSDSTYKVGLNSNNATADEVIANGVTINGGAQFSFSDLGSSMLPFGTVFTMINNTAATPIAGTFSNLADGSIFTNNNTYRVNYEGGTGNDLTLTVVPPPP